MNYKAHRIGGLCLGAITSSLIYQNAFSKENLIITGTLLAGSYIGSLIPDIDNRGSKMGKKFKITSLVINKTFGHRGITHTPLVALILSSILLLGSSYFKGYYQVIYFYFSLGLIVGYISHLLLDATTVSGIPFLYPVIKKSYSIGSFKTGKDDFKVSIILIFITIVVIYLKYINIF